MHCTVVVEDRHPVAVTVLNSFGARESLPSDQGTRRVTGVRSAVKTLPPNVPPGCGAKAPMTRHSSQVDYQQPFLDGVIDHPHDDCACA
jgi:hypothetical protein